MRVRIKRCIGLRTKPQILRVVHKLTGTLPCWNENYCPVTTKRLNWEFLVQSSENNFYKSADILKDFKIKFHRLYKIPFPTKIQSFWGDLDRQETSFCEHYIFQEHVSLIFAAVALCSVLYEVILIIALSHRLSCFKSGCQYRLNFSKVVFQTHSVYEMGKTLLQRKFSTGLTHFIL